MKLLFIKKMFLDIKNIFILLKKRVIFKNKLG